MFIETKDDGGGGDNSGACSWQAARKQRASGVCSWQALDLVSKSAGQRTKRIFEALLKLTNKMAGSMG